MPKRRTLAILAVAIAGFLVGGSSVGLGDEPKKAGEVAKPRRTFRLESSEVLLGEPILVEFRVEVDGPGVWEEPVFHARGGKPGGDRFLMRHEDGTWVAHPFEAYDNMMMLGGTGGYAKVTRDKPFSKWYAVQLCCAIERPGKYQLYAFDWGTGDLPKVGGSIPEAVKAKLKGAEHACGFTQFAVNIRQGTEQERRAMVRRWTSPANAEEGSDRPDVARTAINFARQDDFLPDLKRILWDEDRTMAGAVYIGLAMRDDPRAVDLLFEVGDPEAIGAMSDLRPTQVFAAIPRLIDRLTVPDPRTRAAAEEMLRRWTGQSFGHTWEGDSGLRPRYEEGRIMQAQYRAWWLESKIGFQPRYRLEKFDPFPAEEPEPPKP